MSKAGISTLGHAVIIGGGMCGLLTARVLADFFHKVTIIERDPEGNRRAYRSGVPQARHPHVLLARSQQIVEELFPGIEGDFHGLNVPVFDFGLSSKMLFAAGFAPPVPTGIICRSVSRPRLEAVLRDRVRRLAAVQYQAGYHVTGLEYNHGSNTVTGVSIAPQGQLKSVSAAESLSADLVVDASGRTSHLPDWLARLGLPRPRTFTVNPRLGYATRLYGIPEGMSFDWNILAEFTRAPSATRGCVGLRIEDNQLLFTLQGAGGDYPPGEEAEFLKFADSLRIGFAEVIRELQPRSPILCYRNTTNRWHAYHRVRRWPHGLIVVGDANCVFNPIYGQGITVAAQEAMLLRSMLTRNRHRGVTAALRRHRTHQARLIRWPWILSTAVDRRWQEGPLSPSTAIANLLMDAWLQSIPGSPDMFHRFIKVTHMLSTAGPLLSPRSLARVAGTILRGRRTVEQPPPAAFHVEARR
ncbi:NAD(P)/FAD-dependent oxidoreductase [Streptomyces chattanoogensis]|uniref:NAD(P)/FAD-dependent oxidoreductase n=1 Tax=Streptomyces chattanoogensis TaxID=66876 RepID=UPI0036AE62D3